MPRGIVDLMLHLVVTGNEILEIEFGQFPYSCWLEVPFCMHGTQYWTKIHITLLCDKEN